MKRKCTEPLTAKLTEVLRDLTEMQGAPKRKNTKGGRKRWRS